MEMNKETIKAFSEIDKAIDESFIKLSDKLHNLTLSHNRKKACLLKLKDFFCGMQPQQLHSTDLFYINKWIDDALWSDGAVYYKPKKKITMRDVKRRKKGGK